MACAANARRALARSAGVAVVLGLGGCAHSSDADDRHHRHLPPPAHAAAPHPAQGEAQDARQLVPFPSALRLHTLANMRDHLAAMGAIQAALASGSFDRASEVAERRLGMSSLALHGAHEVGPHMPEGMRDAGTAMHRAASRFALVAKDASASGELRPALAALAALNQTCVACHAAYRLQ